MAPRDYAVDLRVDYPVRSSRGWAALTILLIKFLALLPHGLILVFLTIAQLVVAFVAQIVVAIRGEYPPGMHEFVGGVLRWAMRVSAFLYSLTDRYPPFTLRPDPGYPVDVVFERPARQSRVYAAFTVVVQVLAAVAFVAFVVWLIRDAGDWLARAAGDSGSTNDYNLSSSLGGQTSGGLLLRQIAALPHYVVLVALGIVSVVIWLIVQWIILFTAVYPRGMFDLVVGITRWQTRVSGYALGMIDRYPPFTFEPSIAVPTDTWGAQGTAWAAPGTAWGPSGTSGALGAAPPQWYPDPLARHQYRYWDGAQWTPHVADEGRVDYDVTGLV